MSRNVLAIDLGASNGRAMLGSLEGGRLSLEEVHRFENIPVNVNGSKYWNIFGLLHEIKTGIAKAQKMGGFQSIGIDSWSSDFGLIGKDGELLLQPHHYRDKQTLKGIEMATSIIPREVIYEESGIQFLRFNTLIQLACIAQRNPQLLEQADKVLLIPDLLNYFLTGQIKCEFTNASATQILNPRNRQWSKKLLSGLHIPEHLLPPVVAPGSTCGLLDPAICRELGVPQVPVYCVASHDTASAIAAVPTQEKDFVYISSGTWCLMGTELPEPLINDKTLAYNFTNEGGYEYTSRFLKNIIGLWLVQESRRQWAKEGKSIDYAVLEPAAQAAPAFESIVDSDYPDIDAPENMIVAIQDYCRKTGQVVPKTQGEIMRAIYQGLALKYRYVFDHLRELTERDYNAIHIIGGGTKAKQLSQMAANACGVAVVAGPIEATAIGNIAVQFIAHGDIANLKEARRIISDSFPTQTYTPQDQSAWEAAYQRFKGILESY